MAAPAPDQPPAIATETGHIEIDTALDSNDSAYGGDEYARRDPPKRSLRTR